jgi:hypothetical protein
VKLKKKVAKGKKSKKRKRQYFGKEAHAAIIEFQNAKVINERHNVYVEKIKPSFDKLAENLIFIHGFSTSKEHFLILKSDCVTFLYEILEKFDPSKGSKAFSYFNVCAKNFLIIQSKKRTKNKIRHVSIDDDNLSLAEKQTIENSQIIQSQEDIIIFKEDKVILMEMLTEISKKLSNSNEIACINAIITLFNKIDDLDFLNKRAIFVYLRELSGLSAKQLSVAMSNIRKHYKEMSKSNHEFMLFANN